MGNQADYIETGAESENPTLFGAIGALNIFRSWPTGSARAKMEHVGSAKLIVLRMTMLVLLWLERFLSNERPQKLIGGL